jgi:hypothetical protein
LKFDASRFTHHVSRFTLHASRFTLHASRATSDEQSLFRAESRKPNHANLADEPVLQARRRGGGQADCGLTVLKTARRQQQSAHYLDILLHQGNSVLHDIPEDLMFQDIIAMSQDVS